MAQASYSGYGDLFEGLNKARQVFERCTAEQASTAKKIHDQVKTDQQHKLEELNRILSDPQPLKPQLTPRLRLEVETLEKFLRSEPRQNPANSTVPRQTPHSSQQVVSQGHSQTVQEKSVFRSNAKLQKRVLITIYKQLQGSQKQPIEWEPSIWFGEDGTSKSNQSGWSNTLKKLQQKKLVQKHYPKQYTHNPGNAISYVSLTPKGYQEAKRLIQNS